MSFEIYPQLIEDYISNVEGKPINKITHIEDFLDSVPGKEDQYDGYFGLFEVYFQDGSNQKYVLSINNSSQMVFKGTNDILKDLFPAHITEVS